MSANFAFQMVGVAMGWQMYALTGSALDLGLVGLAQFLPATVLFLVAGQLADRYDRRRIAQISQLVEGCAAAALAYGAFTGTTSKELILIAAFFLGAGRAGESPTMQTLLPAVVPTSAVPARGRGLVGRAAGRHHHRAGGRRPDLCAQPDGGLRDLLRRCSPPRPPSSRSCNTSAR